MPMCRCSRHSGAQANYAAMAAFLKLGRFVSANGTYPTAVTSRMDRLSTSRAALGARPRTAVTGEGLIALRRLRRNALEHRPQCSLAGYSAYPPRIVDFAAFAEIKGESVRSARFCMVALSSLALLVSPRMCTRRPFRPPTSSPPRRTDGCVVRAVANSFEAEHSRRSPNSVFRPRQSRRSTGTHHRGPCGVLSEALAHLLKFTHSHASRRQCPSACEPALTAHGSRSSPGERQSPDARRSS